jgi:hypothetical protein
MSSAYFPHRAGWALALSAVLFAVVVHQAAAQGSGATSNKVNGVLLTPSGGSWKSIAANTAVPTDAPLVSLFDSTLTSANGGVTVRLAADPAQRGPFPILESAVIVHPDSKHDLAVTPLRGLMVLSNTKKQGAATVRITTFGETVEVTLKEPGAKLALEIYSRHAPGAPNLDDPKKDDPIQHLFFIALVGETLLSCNERTITLHAPPGPAVLIWDSLVRQPEVQRLEALPPEIESMKLKDEKTLAECCAWARTLATDPEKALKAGVTSANSAERKAAVVAMGALDDVRGLFGVLATSPNTDDRQQAILALRHWLGREPGQTAKLAAGLQKAGLGKVQSENVIHLLYGFTPEERREPATYNLLVEALASKRPGLRELAHWHLVRLAPEGKTIGYDAQAPEAQRQQAYEAWRKLIPAGNLPPSQSPPAR